MPKITGSKRKRDIVYVPTLKEARRGKRIKGRSGYSSVARTRGAQVTGEMKYFDTALALSAISEDNTWAGTEQDPATFLTFCVPVLGAGVNQRIGKEINILKWKLRGYVNIPQQTNQTTGDPASTVRIICFIDKQTNSAQAQGEQLMTGTASDSTAIHSFQNIDNFGRFRVIYDKTIVIGNPNASYDGTNVEQFGLSKTFKMSHKFKMPLKVRFNNTNGGTVADIVDNSLHMVALTDNDDLAPTISYYSRVNYKE